MLGPTVSRERESLGGTMKLHSVLRIGLIFFDQATTAHIEGKRFAHFRRTRQGSPNLGSVIPGVYGVAVGRCSRKYAFWPCCRDGWQNHEKDAYEKSPAHKLTPRRSIC